MKYLCDTYGKDDSLYPRDPWKRFLVDRQLDYDLGHVFKIVGTFGVSYSGCNLYKL